ncbi:hypothetical protein Q9247_09720 [Halomonas meridiana]|uniref:hypothetical protein n=1 Tax=Vreelandella aquamarina TaxID=77097 RepID=UPI00273B49C3|nr:hypothetical protein [Halomonas meridiana]MDP4557960.1 hypothetical protein [Halomonas meridiana]
MLNAFPLNAVPFNGAAPRDASGLPRPVISNPLERMEVYLLQIGDGRVPMSSFQASMRLAGKSFLQVIVPAGSAVLPALEYGVPMQVSLGYYHPSDDEFDGLETIAQAPLEVIRSDEGPTRKTLSLSGYGQAAQPAALTRQLVGVSGRSINQSRRRVRCSVDLLLRPGDTAIDADGTEFQVGQIQYFVNATAAAMEVLENG